MYIFCFKDICQHGMLGFCSGMPRSQGTTVKSVQDGEFMGHLVCVNVELQRANLLGEGWIRIKLVPQPLPK